uniref:Membrane insertase YidC/Oxa/ALB C-terminal domain-containing protein n=1 Tax=Parascaris univalens TaxID=6257 RepID=A0A915CHZ6_PARUN
TNLFKHVINVGVSFNGSSSENSAETGLFRGAFDREIAKDFESVRNIRHSGRRLRFFTLNCAMFRKSFAVKSNTNLRNSDRRKLLGRLHFADRISAKAQVAHVRLLNCNGVPLNVYTFDRNPLLFEIEDDPNLYPTVYFTWISPESFPCLLIREQVLSFLDNGADLMLPGVIYRRGAFPEFERNYPVTISVVTNDGHLKGPVGVGVALMSSMEMIANGMQGRGVQILHLYKDFLWEFGIERIHHKLQSQLPSSLNHLVKRISRH